MAGAEDDRLKRWHMLKHRTHFLVEYGFCDQHPGLRVAQHKFEFGRFAARIEDNSNSTYGHRCIVGHREFQTVRQQNRDTLARRNIPAPLELSSSVIDRAREIGE